MGSELRSRRGSDEKPRAAQVQGITFWHGTQDGESIELNTHDNVALDIGRSRWTVSDTGREEAEPTIESASLVVSGFLRRVMAAKASVARRKSARRPVPKPSSSSKAKPRQSLPAHAPLPCPLCRPEATKDHPGEAWPDCELCGGDGVVTARAAEQWREEFD
jgi:hypothetical protein